MLWRICQAVFLALLLSACTTTHDLVRDYSSSWDVEEHGALVPLTGVAVTLYTAGLLPFSLLYDADIYLLYGGKYEEYKWCERYFSENTHRLPSSEDHYERCVELLIGKH